jgi:hypothetical protein
MKKQILLTGLLTIFSLVTFAKHVDEQTAKTVGQTFLTTKTNSQQLSATNLTLAYKADFASASTAAYKQAESRTYFYVFNVSSNGFVIVSGDDNVIPILAYSDEGAFDPNNIPNNAKKWLEEYKIQIRDAIENQFQATEEIEAEWQMFKNGSNNNSTAAAASVNPLVQTKWNQNPYYNALCPGGSVTGCVATAMAQIMKFWNYPATGSGFHSYNHSSYGTISANFGSTTYNWGSMPNTLNSNNNAIATLMFHCGVSVDMNYSPQVSGAYVISAMSPVQHCSEYAMKTYFGYKSTMQGVQRVNYNQAQWINLLKTELDASRPILYAGFGSGGGHAFVCDGYDNNDFFHFNWGWGGAYDGYFSINALNPSGTGTGGGSGGYNSGHQALIGIEPPTGSQTFNMGLYNFVTPSASTIGYGQSFSVSTNIANNGTNTFNGDYCAAVFDNQNNFIDFIQILSGYSLQGGFAYQNNLVFSNTGLFSMLPGQYKIGIFYRPTGGNWVQVANSGSYQNLININVINPNDIELNSAMTVSPSTTLIQGQSVSVNLNIVNDGLNTFIGQYGVGLYNLDGTLAQTINLVNENNGLPSGYTYQAPYLTFTNNSITVSPGTYLLAVQHNPNNTGWQLTGSSYYQNPIYVTVQAPALTPDQYEVNNTIAQSYTLPISFSGNTATRNTNGSNLHIGTDNDYYKIQLPAGYDYSINARIHDSYNSGNGNTYSCDALFSYSLDGTSWSDAFDDLMSGAITVSNGGTVYFHVAPFFAGETGTYLLDMTINRTSTVGIKENILSDLIKVFPNPTSNQFQIDLSAANFKVTSIDFLNITGQVLKSIPVSDNENMIILPVTEYSSGVYFLKLTSANGLITKKLIVE